MCVCVILFGPNLEFQEDRFILQIKILFDFEFMVFIPIVLNHMLLNYSVCMYV